MKPFSILAFLFCFHLGFCQFTQENTIDGFGNIVNTITHPDSNVFYQKTNDGVFNNIVSEGRYTSNKKKNGWWRFYHQNGNLKSIGFYHQNLENGYFKNFHENGEIESLGYYQEGKKIGWWEFFDEQRNIEKRGHYVNGVEHGYWHFFNEGIIYKEGFYTFGNPVNTWRFYNEKGELTRVEGFLD